VEPKHQGTDFPSSSCPTTKTAAVIELDWYGWGSGGPTAWWDTDGWYLLPHFPFVIPFHGWRDRYIW
jgi:hypothetical protein